MLFLNQNIRIRSTDFLSLFLFLSFTISVFANEVAKCDSVPERVWIQVEDLLPENAQLCIQNNNYLVLENDGSITATCVAGGSNDMICDPTRLVCQTRKGKFINGYLDQQAKELRLALENGFIHPECPISNVENVCDHVAELSQDLYDNYGWDAEASSRVCVFDEEYVYREDSLRSLCIWAGPIDNCDSSEWICPNESQPAALLISQAIQGWLQCPKVDVECPESIEDIVEGENCGVDRICRFNRYCCDNCGKNIQTCSFGAVAQCKEDVWHTHFLNAEPCVLQACDHIDDCTEEDFGRLFDAAPIECETIDASDRDSFCQCLGIANHATELPQCALEGAPLQDWLHICESEAPCKEHHLAALLNDAPAACIPMVHAIELEESFNHESICACLLEVQAPTCSLENMPLAEWKLTCQKHAPIHVPECRFVDLTPLVATSSCQNVAENLLKGSVLTQDWCQCLPNLHTLPNCTFQGIPATLWKDECALRRKACGSEIASAFFPNNETLELVSSKSELCPYLDPSAAPEIPECTIQGISLSTLTQECLSHEQEDLIIEGLQLSSSDFDLDLLSWEINGEYYFAGKKTCVAFGVHPEDQCDSSQFVCTAGMLSGLANQGSLLLEALNNGGVHPHCPSTLLACEIHTLIARSPHECVPLIGKVAYDESFCDCLLTALTPEVSDCDLLGESMWNRYYDCESRCSVLELEDEDGVHTGFWTRQNDDVFISDDSGLTLSLGDTGKWHIENETSGHFDHTGANATFSGNRSIDIKCTCRHGVLFDHEQFPYVCVYRTQLYVNNEPTCIQVSDCLPGFVCAETITQMHLLNH